MRMTTFHPLLRQVGAALLLCCASLAASAQAGGAGTLVVGFARRGLPRELTRHILSFVPSGRVPSASLTRVRIKRLSVKHHAGVAPILEEYLCRDTSQLVTQYCIDPEELPPGALP